MIRDKHIQTQHRACHFAKIARDCTGQIFPVLLFYMDDYEGLGLTSNRFRFYSGKIGWWNPKIDEMSER